VATPLLLAAGAAGLGWRRLRSSELGRCQAAYELRQAYRLHTLEADMHECDLIPLVRWLRGAGIEPLLGKGWAVARLYPEPGLRPYGDFDLCVSPEQYEPALAALGQPDAPRASVDLHRGLSRPRDGQAFSLLDDRRLEELYERSQLVPLGDVEVRVLGAEDHLRLLCLHMLSHGACRPLWLCDVGAALEARPADFDWDWLLTGDRRRTAGVIAALGLAHQLLGARIDDTPVAERARALPGWLVPTVLRQWSTPFRQRSPLAALPRHPAGAWREIRHHWPNGMEATVGIGAPFNNWPRLPFQLASVAVRAIQFITVR
jgi:putative nucleotidyltransferase-like protein